jgi:hypothetical protein
MFPIKADKNMMMSLKATTVIGIIKAYPYKYWVNLQKKFDKEGEGKETIWKHYGSPKY